MSIEIVRFLTVTKTADVTCGGAIVFSAWDLQRLRAAPAIILPSAPAR